MRDGVTGDLVPLGRVPAEVFPGKAVSSFGCRSVPNRVGSARLPKLGQEAVDHLGHFVELVVPNVAAQALRIELTDLGHALCRPQVVEHRGPLEYVRGIRRYLLAFPDDLHNRAPGEGSPMAGAGDIPRDYEECGWQAALIQQRDADPELIDR